MKATSEFVVPRSIPTMRSAVMRSSRLLRLLRPEQRGILRLSAYYEPAVAVAVVTMSLGLARKKAAGQRAPGANAEAQFLGCGDVFPLDVALDQRVLQLQCDEAILALFFRESVSTGYVPRGSVREPVMANLAFAD